METRPDYGKHMIERNYTEGSTHIFHGCLLYNIQKIDARTLASSTVIIEKGEEFMITIEFPKILFKSLRKLLPKKIRPQLKDPAPFHIDLGDPVKIGVIETQLGKLQMAITDEEFIPFIGQSLRKITDYPAPAIFHSPLPIEVDSSPWTGWIPDKKTFQ